MRSTYVFALLALIAIASAFQSDKKSDKTIKKMLANEFALVPSGLCYVGDEKVTVQQFYMLKREVTNANYREFLNDLRAKGKFKELEIARVDSSKWNMGHGFFKPMAEHYHSHEAYNNYPVVNISHEGAELYCQWLSAKYNKQLGTQKFKFRLPLEAEIVRAARGDAKNISYSWGTNSLRNEKGDVMCNHLNIGAESIHFNQEVGNYEIKKMEYTITDDADILAPSKSYWPNNFGIYNLNGNAAEMLATKGVNMGGSWRNTGYDVRIESKHEYSGANPTTGFRVVMTWVE